MEYTEYTVISEKDLEALIAKVNELLREGWHLQGGHFIACEIGDSGVRRVLCGGKCLPPQIIPAKWDVGVIEFVSPPEISPCQSKPLRFSLRGVRVKIHA